MAHQCPHCGGPVQRGYSAGAQHAAGLAGALFYAAFSSFECKNCGKVPFRAFPPDVRSKIIVMSMFLIILAIALLIGVIALIIYLQ